MNDTPTCIEPGRAPGGFAYRFTDPDGVITWDLVPHMSNLNDATLAAIAAGHHRRAVSLARPGRPSVLDVFDGDTGEWSAQIVTDAGR